MCGESGRLDSEVGRRSELDELILQRHHTATYHPTGRDKPQPPNLSTHANRLHAEKRRNFFDLFRNVADPNRAVMRRTLRIPGVHEAARIEGEFVAAIGVADLENGAGDRVTFSGEKLELPITRLHH